ncbi:DegT/DnrJ/EryC1/StrS family aminotransferase [Mesorhizobium sp. M1060]|uniref:DegT/DnrJ/EryC1/StrS family aminotransferase n=1 Tax=unclassified Mesorhizobium TaxID=325217 RepID=UPI00067D052D|nr:MULTISPECIES: DegT/DnrJ/EryC1/StrS family aminotransferase [unclassified Mesorhizobium]WJI52739.1 DegT/DnrJ/EryC1/StrS family aminotransferase [Mesorhizobium sp. C089B]
MNADGLWDADPGPAPDVPVSRPRLPTGDSILPYLHEIDATRWYSNNGPLNRRFQEALKTRTAAGHVVCGANATLGLALALMAQKPAKGSLCMMPSWTFAASAHAAVLAGLVPWLVDVDLDSQQLLPESAAELLRQAPGGVGAVMPVMPFGRPIGVANWDRFKSDTGLAVVIDAAAAFDTLTPSRVPAVVSLHATKALGIGEGCFIASDDGSLIEEIAEGANFGFSNSREAVRPALNGKLSEYGAAVGLAALELWPHTRAAYKRVATSYSRSLGSISGLSLPEGFGEKWISSTVTIGLPPGSMDRALTALAKGGVGVRRWWGGGLHRHAAFEHFPRLPLQTTDILVATQLGLPCWTDLADETISRICSILSEVAAAG